MVARRLGHGEGPARLLLMAVLTAVPALILGAWLLARDGDLPITASMPERGGWSPDILTARVSQPLHLRLTSDDVVHGFAIGQSDEQALDVLPGKVSEVTLTFDKPGTYTFYCTRWCGPNHWRMRGMIEVTGSGETQTPAGPPLYVQLGIDIDAPHEADTVPEQPPSAGRGEELGIALPPDLLSRDVYLAQSPAAAWQDLRDNVTLAKLSDADLWDLVAYVWRAQTSTEALQRGRELYAANCAACHGETGAGDGVMANLSLGINPQATDFSDLTTMLGASSALLQGKILRGGMGTGMPYWGPIFTEADTWALVDYLWTFAFPEEETK